VTGHVGTSHHSHHDRARGRSHGYVGASRYSHYSRALCAALWQAKAASIKRANPVFRTRNFWCVLSVS